jgi:Putative addiction module component
MKSSQALLAEVLLLPIEDRAEVAAEILASLDDASIDDEAQVRLLWADEIAKRARRVVSGETEGIPWVNVKRRITDRLSSQ